MGTIDSPMQGDLQYDDTCIKVFPDLCMFRCNNLFFYQVYIDVLSSEDLLFITSTLFPNISEKLLGKMISFNSKVFEIDDFMLYIKYSVHMLI